MAVAPQVSAAAASTVDAGGTVESSGTVGFIGAGSMGGPMVRRLLAAGIVVHLFARRAAVADPLGEQGAVLEPSIAAAARAADVLIVCPFSEGQLFDIAAGPDGALANLRAGSVLVQHATVSPTAVRQLATEAPDGVTVLDAPISGTADAIRAGALTVLAGGDETAVARVEPILRAYSKTVVRTGDLGTASIVKLVNNLTFAAHVQTGIAAVDLGRTLGVEADLLLRALTACSADSYALRALAAVGDTDLFTQLALPYLRKDVALARTVATGLGLDTGFLGEAVRTGPADLAGTGT